MKNMPKKKLRHPQVGRVLCLIIASLLFTAPVSADPRVLERYERVQNAPWPFNHIRPDMDPLSVVRYAGEPTGRITADVWFFAIDWKDQVAMPGRMLDIMMIRFNGGKVDLMKQISYADLENLKRQLRAAQK